MTIRCGRSRSRFAEHDAVQRARVRAPVAQAVRHRPPRGRHRLGRPRRLPARAGLPPGRADRRLGVRAAVLRLQARARQRDDRRPGRRGRRRAVLRAIRPTCRRIEIATGPVAAAKGSLPGPLRASCAAAARERSPRRGHELHSEVLARAAQPDGQLWWGGAVGVLRAGLRPGDHAGAARCA